MMFLCAIELLRRMLFLTHNVKTKNTYLSFYSGWRCFKRLYCATVLVPYCLCYSMFSLFGLIYLLINYCLFIAVERTTGRPISTSELHGMLSSKKVSDDKIYQLVD